MNQVKENHDWSYMVYVFHEIENKWLPFIGYDTVAECSHFLSLQPMLRPAKIVKQEVISTFEKTEFVANKDLINTGTTSYPDISKTSSYGIFIPTPLKVELGGQASNLSVEPKNLNNITFDKTSI